MTKVCVLDCSAWVAYFLNEPGSAAVGDILDQSGLLEVTLHAPPLLQYELRNALLFATRKKRCSREDCMEYHELFATFPVHYEWPATSLALSRIDLLADRHSLTFYDAAYLELAERLGAKLKTFDKALLALKSTYAWIE